MQRTPPQKRRKTSPTTSVPVDAPTTLGRLPPSQQDGTRTPTRRPSFASPTKASIARHNPQLLNRPLSSGQGSEKPGNKGKLDDLFAKALGESNAKVGERTPGIGESPRRPPSRGSRVLGDDKQTPEGPRRFPQSAKGASAVGEGLSAKPRRGSQSPFKSPVKQTDSAAPRGIGILGENLPDNPFQKKTGLRRSPISSQPVIDTTSSFKENQAEDDNPFQKKATLRRSPIPSQPTAIEEPTIAPNGPPQVATPARKSALRRSPIITEALTLAEPIGQVGTHAGASPVRRGALRRSPILGLPPPPTLIVDNVQETTPEDVRRIAEAALRLSPTLGAVPSLLPSSPSIPQHGNHPGISPVRKGALRRSPVVNVLQPTEVESPIVETNAARTTLENTVLTRRRSPRLRESLAASSERGPEELEPPIARQASLNQSPTAQEATPTHNQTQLEEPVQVTESTTPRESPPAFIPADVDTSIDQQEESEASVLREAANLPTTRSSALKNTQRQQEPVLPLAFPKKALLDIPLPKPVAHGPPSRRTRREEPDLPPTPTQRGIPDPVMTTPPAGIKNTPSKKVRKSRALSERLKSSPLKPRDPPPQMSSQEIIPDSFPEEPVISSTGKAKAKELSVRRKSARFTITPDPYAEKRAARDALLKELQQLQADVALANQENERLRQNQDSKKKRAQPAPNAEEIVALLQRTTAAPVKPVSNPPSIFKDISSFLPFSSRRKRQAAGIAELNKPIPSHRPLEVDDPISYLKAFSTLTYKSTITLLPTEQNSSASTTQDTEQPILQHHLITASHPSGLFSARISMTVDTSTLKVKSITPTVDPAAENELGTFVRGRASGANSIGKDINVICWAMTRWSETAIKRARFWHAVQNELQTPEARLKSLRKLGRKAKRKVVEEDENEERVPPTRKELLVHIGRTRMEIVNEEVEILVHWGIGFDWTGEVECDLGVDVRVLDVWRDADERNSLAGIPKMFQGLVKEKGPLGAVRVVVGLLMGGEGV